MRLINSNKKKQVEMDWFKIKYQEYGDDRIEDYITDMKLSTLEKEIEEICKRINYNIFQISNYHLGDKNERAR
jgi:hypothetical protein